MEEAGWLTSFWGESENNRRARYYRRTREGGRQLGVEVELWTTIPRAIASALKANKGLRKHSGFGKKAALSG
jgi:PadR family transcriptional regulator, regulatory protein PadR